MVVEFSRDFVKSLKKYSSKTESKRLIRKLSATTPSEMDFVTSVANIVIREKRIKSFRYYFINDQDRRHIITKEELDYFLIKFVALSKKNNQQQVINNLKEELQRFGFEIGK